MNYTYAQEVVAACCRHAKTQSLFSDDNVAELPVDDGSALAFEITDDALLVMRLLPKNQPDQVELLALLEIADASHGWHLGVAPGLSAHDQRPMLWVRLEDSEIDFASVQCAIDTLNEAYRRWQHRVSMRHASPLGN
ncbi:type III secretion system chaperone [Pandoraea commovens]|uniref:type III secretion system chaperone n=1 Tax=Pandoraea commovens TaxID=2508289 RepID=UPI0012424885|nr:type III secretion system chaperone [Pandoraea commovens]